ncbi:MAG: FAD-dependent oxidoreductase [Burkholderiales bacterium]|nr:FAD-dependent oxidoreductase [Burkholderiales bacterium]
MMEADVVVVGGGGSGLAAAIGARESGANVVLLEKNPALGGTTARSIGSISASGTAQQKRRGIVDTPEAHFEDMALFSKKYTSRPDNDPLRRVLADNVPETVNWLGALGVEFFGPLEEPPHRKPRMHNVIPGSRAYIFHLERHARKIGVHIITSARARALVRDGERVRGVEVARADGAVETVRARRGVVLASGDYSANPDMKRELISEAAAAIEPINPTSTGDGQRMALALGAHIVNGDMHLAGIRFVPPARPSWISRLPPSRWLTRPASIALRIASPSIVRRFLMGFLTTVLVPQHELFEAGAILVNKRGERFTDEKNRAMHDVSRQPEGIAYIVFDAALARKFSCWPHYVSTAPGVAYAYLSDYQKFRRDLYHRGETIDGLAFDLGMDAVHLARAVAGEVAAEGVAPARASLGAGPYYALGPVKLYINFTDGGVAVNERLQVLGRDSGPIPGLYAAGSAGQGGLLLKGHGHHLGWAFTSGRLAGRYAASEQVAISRATEPDVAAQA